MRHIKDEEVVEIEMYLERHRLNFLSRLVEDGFFDSVSDAVSYALSQDNPESNSDIVKDPKLENYTQKLKEISGSAESDAVAHFFADTLYMTCQYGELLNELDRDIGRLEHQFAAMGEILVPERDSEAVKGFLYNSKEYAEDLRDLSGDDTQKEAVAEDYLDRYFPSDLFMKPLLE